jgi:integrase
VYYDESKKAWRVFCRNYLGKSYDLTAATESDLKVKVALRRKEIEEQKRRISRTTTVKDWSIEYINAYRLDSVSSAHAVNLESYRRWIADELGDMRLMDVKPLHCRKAAAQLSGYSKSHATKIIAFMSAMFDAAEENDLILKNPARRITAPASCTEGKRRALTDSERAQFLEYADLHPHGLWIKVMLYCGLRSGETERMIGKHIYVKNRVLYVDGTKSRKAKRTVPIPAALMPDLEPYARTPFKLIFTNARGESINKACRRRMWSSFVRGLNLHLGAKTYRNEIVGIRPVADDITPHCLRHTYASWLEQKNIPLRVAADFLGHEKTGVTEDYTHLTDTTFAEAAAKIDAE